MPSKNQTLRPILSTMPEWSFLIMFILPTDSTKNQGEILRYSYTSISKDKDGTPKFDLVSVLNMETGEQDSEISDLGMAALRAFRLEEAEKKANKEKNRWDTDMPNMELLLEAEKRGILPPEKAGLLQEARKRGLVPGGTPEPQSMGMGEMNKIIELTPPTPPP